MNSTGTAPTRVTEGEGPKQLQTVAHRPTQPTIEAVRAAASNNVGVTNKDETNRVEQLLAQLEARSMALVPYVYKAPTEEPAKKANVWPVAGGLLCLWLSTLLLGISYISFKRPAPVPVVERITTAAPLVIPSVPDQQEQNVANSVDHLAKALAASSERLNQIEVELEKSNRDMRHLATKVNSGQTATIPASAEIAVSPAPSVTDSSLTKRPYPVMELKPTDAATPHRTADGSIDYWLVARSADKEPAKVLPVATSADGVVIYNLEDGKNYTLTPQGEWHN